MGWTPFTGEEMESGEVGGLAQCWELAELGLPH